MFTETENVPGGQGLRYPFFPETASPNKIKTITVKCDWGGGSDTCIEEICSCFLKVTGVSFPEWLHHICSLEVGVEISERWGLREKRIRVGWGHVENESGQSVCIKVTAGLMRTE